MLINDPCAPQVPHALSGCSMLQETRLNVSRMCAAFQAMCNDQYQIKRDTQRCVLIELHARSSM